MPEGFCARALVRLAVVLLLCAAAAAVWELFASQAPGSYFYIGALPGPIAALRALSATLALVLLAAAWLLPWAYGKREPRLVLALCYAGAALSVGTSFYGALKNMYLVQLESQFHYLAGLMTLKYGGQALLGICLIDLSWRILWRKPPP